MFLHTLLVLGLATLLISFAAKDRQSEFAINMRHYGTFLVGCSVPSEIVLYLSKKRLYLIELIASLLLICDAMLILLVHGKQVFEGMSIELTRSQMIFIQFFLYIGAGGFINGSYLPQLVLRFVLWMASSYLLNYLRLEAGDIDNSWRFFINAIVPLAVAEVFIYRETKTQI